MFYLGNTLLVYRLSCPLSVFLVVTSWIVAGSQWIENPDIDESGVIVPMRPSMGRSKLFSITYMVLIIMVEVNGVIQYHCNTGNPDLGRSMSYTIVIKALPSSEVALLLMAL